MASCHIQSEVSCVHSQPESVCIPDLSHLVYPLSYNLPLALLSNHLLVGVLHVGKVRLPTYSAQRTIE